MSSIAIGQRALPSTIHPWAMAHLECPTNTCKFLIHTLDEVPPFAVHRKNQSKQKSGAALPQISFSALGVVQQLLRGQSSASPCTARNDFQELRQVATGCELHFIHSPSLVRLSRNSSRGPRSQEGTVAATCGDWQSLRRELTRSRQGQWQGYPSCFLPAAACSARPSFSAHYAPC